MGRVVVLGSLNIDHTVDVDRLPHMGQTVLGRSYNVTLGGKGLNQAVTAAREGAEVTMVGCVGDDDGGRWLLGALAGEGIDLGFVRRHYELPTGRAHVTVERRGRNTIVVVPGANAAVAFPSAALEGASVLLAQLECPLDVVAAVFVAARTRGVLTVLNPAPARPLPAGVFDAVDLLVPNETEADRLGEALYRGTVIITQGERGARVLRPGQPDIEVDPFPVDPVDTTAAGDAFCGSLAAALARGERLEHAVKRAAAAGALATTIPGALPSLPRADDIDRLVGRSR